MFDHYPNVDVELLQLATDRCTMGSLSINAVWWQHTHRYPEFIPALPIASADVNAEFVSQIFALDMAHIWLRSAVELSTRVLDFHALSDREPPVVALAVATIAGRIAFDLLAVRILVTSGMDAQAKQIARGVSENLDALALASTDEAFCEAFVASATPEACNGVWHRFIAKGKARKAISRLKATVGNAERLEQAERFRRQEEAILGASVHPSAISGAHSIFQEFGGGRHSGPSRGVSPYSLRTLGFCNFRCGEYAGFDKFVVGTVEAMCDATPTSFGNVFTAYSKTVCRAFRDIVGATNDRLAAMSQARATHEPVLAV